MFISFYFRGLLLYFMLFKQKRLLLFLRVLMLIHHFYCLVIADYKTWNLMLIALAVVNILIVYLWKRVHSTLFFPDV